MMSTRRIFLAPYRRGMGPSFTLLVSDDGYTHKGYPRIAYDFRICENGNRGVTLFKGRWISPYWEGDGVDSDRELYALLESLCDQNPKPGMTPAQVTFLGEHACHACTAGWHLAGEEP